MGFTCALPVTGQAVVSYTALPPLPRRQKFRQSPLFCLRAVYFCCTFLGVASTGRYPASCPVKPGLSSPAGLPKAARQPRLFVLLELYLSHMETASADKLPANGICRDILAVNPLEILKEFQKPLGLVIFRLSLPYPEKKRLHILL